MCTDRFASEQQVSTEGRDRLEHERQIIIPYLQFTCNGRITRLIVATDRETGRESGLNPVIFQIWKPTGDATFRLFGMIDLPEGVTIPGNPNDFLLVNFSIPADVNLFFHHGDVVGYYQPNELRARIWTIRNDSYVAYRLRTDNYTATFDLNGDEVQTRDERQPLIQVVYGKYYMLIIRPGQQKGTKLAQNTPYQKIINILSSVYYIYFLSVLKCYLLNCSLMVKLSFQWLQQIISYATNLKNIVKFMCPLGSFSLAHSPIEMIQLVQG